MVHRNSTAVQHARSINTELAEMTFFEEKIDLTSSLLVLFLFNQILLVLLQMAQPTIDGW